MKPQQPWCSAQDRKASFRFPEHTRMFLWARDRKAFFFEKKKQKTFG
jgi:hypothetical protein